MKQYSKKLFSLAVLCSTATVMLQASNDNANRVVPFLQWRSQGRAMDRKLYGTTSWSVYQGDMDNNYGTVNVTLQYDQTFRGKDLAHCLFGPALIENVTTGSKCDNDCGSAIVISGLESVEAPATRGARELMAENFLLPRDFKSVVTFSPKVQDVVVDLNLFVGLDRWVSGLYFRLYGPIVWNKASLKPSEVLAEDSFEGDYTQGFFDPAAEVPVSGLFKNALSFFGGCEFPGGYDDESVTVQPLRFAKFSDYPVATSNSCDNDCNSSSHHKTGFAELRGEFGYNYIQEKYRLLINLQAAAPTGSKVKAEYLFPAQVGNGHHWELGVGLGGAWRMWSSEDMEKSFNFIVEADITHLFNAKQQRTFDLKCKPLSRYMLAQKLIEVEDEGEQLTAPAGTKQFNAAEGEYAPVANFSTRNVKVSIGVQGDLVAMFNYTCRGFSWDLGYNFWAMSSSKISLKCDDNCDDSCNATVVPFPADTWALKGDASIAGYVSAADDAAYFGLGATESKATIFKGTGTGLNLNNANIDTTVTAAFGNVDGDTPTALGVFGTTTPINSSSEPIFISIDDLDIAGAEQRGLSHKVFTHFSYTWRDVSDKWMPYVGAGFSAEFGSHSGSGDCDTTDAEDCNTCPSSLSCALSKWAVEIKGGVSFH